MINEEINLGDFEKVPLTDEQIEKESPNISASSIFSDFPEPEILPGKEKTSENTIRSGDNDDAPEIKETKEKRGRKKKSETAMMVLNGKLLMAIVDLAIPFMISLTHNLFSKVKIDIKHIKMTKDQKDEYKDLFDEVAEQLKIYIPAYYLILLAIGGIYSANYNLAKIEAMQKESVK